MSSIFHHGQEKAETEQKKGWFGGDGSSSPSDDEKKQGGAHAGAAEGGRQRRKTRGSRQTVRVYCKSNTHFNLTVRNNEVVLAPSDADESQAWVKDDTWGSRVQDDAGFPAFALVNRGTGLALKHASKEGERVRLAPYNPETLDESVLWTTSEEFEGGFKAIRKANDTSLNLDAWKADPENGGVKDGTIVTLYTWNKGPNQLWKTDVL
eukprot:TRINITY_DN48_c0_g1_i1.p1 TRINITY_DN48_c0_g1~~TRINITY_DN48_c0_g1_i1.p1  ORF type:complete len:208 (-),score=31.59 TRINITY_DN48_c0_g1_i1:422-1045(-)